MMRARLKRFVDDARGVATLEFALLGVVFILMFLLAAFAWRVTQTAGAVSDAAAEAARAASLALGDGGDAEAVASASLLDAGVPCVALGVAVSGGSTGGAGSVVQTVSVSVSCEVALSDLAPLQVPGNQQFESTHTEVIDVYIGGV